MILTNTLVPQACLSSILQNQQGVAFHALTISPFLVIDDKYVEVFNGDKICEGINKCWALQDMRGAPPEDMHMKILLLNANAYGRF